MDGTALSSHLQNHLPCTHPRQLGGCPQPKAEPSLSPLPTDYGIKPKQPRVRTRAARERPAGLRRAGKSKRDEFDLLEYYYDARL